MRKPVLTPEHQAARAEYKARRLRTELGAVCDELPADDLQVLLDLARKFRAFDLAPAGFDEDLPAVVMLFGTGWERCFGCNQPNHDTKTPAWRGVESGIHMDSGAVRRYLADPQSSKDRLVP